MVLTQEGKEFIDKWALLFADNEFENITEETFRTFANDAAQLREKGQYRAVQLAGPGFTAQAILGSEAIEPFILYAIKGTPDPTDPAGLAGTWNQSGKEEIVYVPGLFAKVFASTGWVLGAGNTTTFVSVDIAAGSYQALSSGTGDAIPLAGTAPNKPVTGDVSLDDNVAIEFTSGGGNFKFYGDGGQVSIVDVTTGHLVALINATGLELVNTSLKLSLTGNSPVSAELSIDSNGDLLVDGQSLDALARAAQLNRTPPPGTTTVSLAVEAPTDYGTAASGTFTVDATGCVVGKTACFTVGAGATAPLFTNAPAGQPYKFVPSNIYASGKAFNYSILVRSDRIEVVIFED